MLWCRNRSRYGIYDCTHCVQHGDARTLDWKETARRDRHDHAQADAVSVRCRPAPMNSSLCPRRYQGQIGAALVLGGVDVTGPQLFTIHPHGSTDKLPYVTMGSGSLAAMAVFEAGWKPNMERQEALDLVTAAISAGIFNDLGSGSNVDACVITKDHTETLRNYRKLNERPQKENTYRFRRGTTAWTKESIRSLIVDETVVPLPPPVSTAGDAMDTS